MKLKLQSQCSTRAYLLPLRDEASSFVARLMNSKRVSVFHQKHASFGENVSYEHSNSHKYFRLLCDIKVLNSMKNITATLVTETKLINSL